MRVGFKRCFVTFNCLTRVSHFVKKIAQIRLTPRVVRIIADCLSVVREGFLFLFLHFESVAQGRVRHRCRRPARQCGAIKPCGLLGRIFEQRIPEFEICPEIRRVSGLDSLQKSQRAVVTGGKSFSQREEK